MIGGWAQGWLMNTEIVIVRDGETYRLLHGHLHLSNAMSQSNEVLVDVHGEGTVKVVRTAKGFRVHSNDLQLPLLQT